MGKNPMRLPVLVIGAGAWGTAIAVHFARRADQGRVILAGRDADQMLAVNAHRENKKYLPGVILPATLKVTSDLSAACVDWRAQAQAFSFWQHPYQALRHRLLRSLGSLARPSQERDCSGSQRACD